MNGLVVKAMSAQNNSKQSIARDKVVRDMAEAITKALKTDGKPWMKPWDTSKCTSGLAHNVVSKKPYRGINQFILGLSGELEYGTFRNWSEVGRKYAIENGEWEWATNSKGERYKKTTTYYGVQKGMEAHTVVFFKMIKVKDKDDPDETVRIPILKWFKVFGRYQTNIPAPKLEEVDPVEYSKREQDMIDNIKQYIQDDGITFAHGGSRAYYSPSRDHIQMPDEAAFNEEFGYCATLAHEAVHSTGHKSRIDRKFGVDKWDDSYAFEELVAEMGASLLCKHFNILPGEALEDGLENQVSYMKSWLSRMESDPKYLIRAGTKAQAAMDYILKTTFEEEKKDD